MPGQIAKNFLLDFYKHRSRMPLMAQTYGLSRSAGMIDIIEAVAKKLGNEAPWYCLDDYDINNVLDHTINIMNEVSIKKAECSK